MRLTALLLLGLTLHVSARTYSQTVTYTGKNVPLEQIFSAIEKQTGFVVFYDYRQIIGSKPVTVAAKNQPLKAFLDSCFGSQPFSYAIEDKTIIITGPPTAVPPTADTSLPLHLPLEIHGQVMNENGERLPGINVMIKGSGRGAVTDADGRFSLNAMIGQLLVFSSVEYQTREVKITTANSSTGALSVSLSKKVTALQDVVINKGYYSTTQKLNTGDVSTVKGEAIERQPLNDPILALEGLVPGLFIQQSSGMPGAGIKVSLRGTNSITAGTNPLYIIDGVPFNGASVDAQSGSSTGIGGQPNGSSDPLSMIDPMSIEKIEILKDADATAIYGSRGANGVILITTKRGKAGATRLTINAATGAGKVTRMLPMLGTAGYLAIRRKAFANDNITPTAANAPDLVTWSQTDNVNYEKMLIGGTARNADITAMLTGGDKQTNFMLSGTLHRETPPTPGSSRYLRGAMNMAVDHTSLDGKLKVSFSTIYSLDNNLIYGTDFTATSIAFPGNYPLYSSGSLYWYGNFSNPLATLKQNYKTATDNLILNAAVSYNILPNLQIKASLGQSKIELDQKLLSPGSSSNPVYNSQGSGLYSNNSTKVYIAEPQINYNTAIAKGKLDVTAGGSWQTTNFNQPLFVAGQGYASDALLDDWSSAQTFFITRNTSSQYKYVSVFGRLNYTWQDKYVLNGTFRRDGSSRFGPDKKFGEFGSVGAAWIFSEERFLNRLHWLSYGKLRGSYGIVGNDQISNYGYLDTYSPAASPRYGANNGYIPTKVANPDYSWERTRKLEFAMELGLLKNRLNFVASWFHNRSNSLLVNAPLSPQTGFTSYTANLPALVQNTGLEVEVKATLIDKKEFTWTVSFNISAYQNKLLAFPGILNSNYANTYVVGQSLHIIPLYHFTGFQNGNATVQDVNKDGTVSAGLAANGKGDYIVAANTDPTYYGGFTNSLRYKGWQLDLLFNFVKQKGFTIVGFPGQLYNQTKDIVNSGFTASTLSTSASYASYVNYYINSDARIQDASFVRLKNLSLSYSLPAEWGKAVKMTHCSFYVRGQNLLTLTGFKGLDPETPVTPLTTRTSSSAPNGALLSLPPLRMFTAGIQCTF